MLKLLSVFILLVISTNASSNDKNMENLKLQVLLSADKKIYRYGDTVFASLKITNSSNRKVELKLVAENFSGREFSSIIWYEIYQGNHKIYTLPHYTSKILSNSLSRHTEFVVIGAKDSYVKEFKWDTKRDDVAWWRRWKKTGRYKMVVRLNLSPQYARVEEYSKLNAPELEFEIR